MFTLYKMDVVFYYLHRLGEAEPKKNYRLAWGKMLNKYFSGCPAMQAKLKAADFRYMSFDPSLPL
jgi:hypothetical protein